MTAGIKVACPQLGIETVAAGGGSKLTYKNGLFVVGPESVGAHPGPACYRKGGDLAITDANAVLGRLIPSQFPNIFGPNADESLDVQASFDKFAQLTKEINASRPGLKPYTLEEVAAGFIKVANEGMSRPMRSVCCFSVNGKGMMLMQCRLPSRKVSLPVLTIFAVSVALVDNMPLLSRLDLE